MYCKRAICKSGQFEFDSVINWSCLSRGSDGEKRGALSTTRAIKAILHALQFRGVLFGNVINQWIAVIKATTN